TPVRVGGIGGALAIAAGSYHTCTALADGTMRCWGAGVSGQLGDGKTAGSSAPVTVKGMKSAAALLWASSNPEVATIDSNGRVTPLRPGLTTISATSRGVSGSTILLVEAPGRPAGGGASSAGPALAAVESGNEP
ncbi:MAG TPA: Ig-like domain-containing protein, partial [Candidatus Manganitrophaceae bacterium]|nr:Ig-like domain-containing protein [Candidatus Manganitrophaceae bacterium]